MKTAKLNKKKKYDLKSPLKEDEYLLRIEEGTGFLTKLNKDGTVSKNFTKWRNRSYGWSDDTKSPEELDIMVHKETFSKGWKFVSFRGGESRDWAILEHPLGFQLEVYVSPFIDLIQKITIINGELQGKFKWTYSELIQEEKR